MSLRGEVYFPNLDFEKKTVDFGCILNDTEVTRYVNITNNSPMDVRYKWSFLVGEQPHAIWNRRPKPRFVEAPEPEIVEVWTLRIFFWFGNINYFIIASNIQVLEHLQISYSFRGDHFFGVTLLFILAPSWIQEPEAIEETTNLTETISGQRSQVEIQIEDFDTAEVTVLPPDGDDDQPRDSVQGDQAEVSHEFRQIKDGAQGDSALS